MRFSNLNSLGLVLLTGTCFLQSVSVAHARSAASSRASVEKTTSTPSSSSSILGILGGSTKVKKSPPPPEKSTPLLSSMFGGSTKVKTPPSAVEKSSSSSKKKARVSASSSSSVKTQPPPPPATPPPRNNSNSASLAVQPTRRQPQPKPNSLEAFAADIATVLKELRADQNDPTVSHMFHSKARPTFAVTWTHDMWDRHTSRWRFVNNFLFWHQSALLKRVIPQLTVLMIWTHFAIQIIETQTTKLAEITFPMTSLSLVSGFVASLLALRSNQGLSRLMEARQAFGKVVFYTRDMSSLVANFVYPQKPALGLKLARHLACFSWLLKNFLRGRKVTGDDEDLIRTMLPDKADADYVLKHRKMPVAVVMRLRQALAHLSHEHALSTAEELAIDHTIQSMDQSIMLTERIVASPIPPLFTTHAGRLLTFYLFFLPLALHSSGVLNRVGTFLTVLAVGYAMLGMDEISHLMEQPFKLAPLYHLCKNSMRDVADSFCLRPPSLNDDKNRQYQAKAQPYWPDGIPTGLEGS